jgi:hypothetical protein
MFPAARSCNYTVAELLIVQGVAQIYMSIYSYNPRCRSYKKNREDVEVVREYSGKGYCPFDTRHNSTSLFTGD